MDFNAMKYSFSMSEECIKVFVRIRPSSQKEKTKKQDFIQCDPQEKQITVINISQENQSKRIFGFDDIFLPSSTQSEIFEETGQKLVNYVMEGYNGTILAYGQTGSGKTYTMMGYETDEKIGLIPRCFELILSMAQSTSKKDYLVMCSYIEIYNQEIRDLLNTNPKGKLEIRESPEKGIFIPDMRKLTVTNEQEMLHYLRIGNGNRATGQTLMNPSSSRSHSIFTIYVESLEKYDDQTEKLIGSKFNLVDLAGSQRVQKTGSTGQRLFESIKINLSLTALSKVISALVRGKAAHIPYRDSKLTRLLQDSLGGNTKTIMIATISPSFYNYEETVSTLKYASRVKYIVNVPIINTDPKDALIMEYENQIQRLRGLLNQMHEPNTPEISQLKSENQKLVKLMEQEKSQLIQNIKTLEQKVIYPNKLSKKLLSQRQKREEKLSLIEKNYKSLEEEVKQMRNLLSELRVKYKHASKQIVELENEHQKERQKIEEESYSMKKQNAMFKSILKGLFTNKQLNSVISLGNWEGKNTFKLPSFYFKDKQTLAFPCDDEKKQIKARKKMPTKKNIYNRSTHQFNRSHIFLKKK